MLKKLFLLFTAVLILLTGCAKKQQPPVPMTDVDPAPTETNPADVYCGNTQTTILYNDQAYTVMGAPSVTLTDLLLHLDYDPEKVCKCADYALTVTTEFGGPYYISLNERYARCQNDQGVLVGQADLTEEQLQTIKTILQNLK